jgi:hypothetical protein
MYTNDVRKGMKNGFLEMSFRNRRHNDASSWKQAARGFTLYTDVLQKPLS